MLHIISFLCSAESHWCKWIKKELRKKNQRKGRQCVPNKETLPVFYVITCQEKTVPKNQKIFGTVCRLLIRASMIFYFQEVRMMFMNGEYVKTIEDLKRCLSLEELVYNYYSGELEIWLRKIGGNRKRQTNYSISRKTMPIFLFSCMQYLDGIQNFPMKRFGDQKIFPTECREKRLHQ